MFLNLNNSSNLNSNCSNLLDIRNHQEQVKKAFCYQKLFWPFTVWINYFSDRQNFCKFSLEFQTFFSITRTIFLNLGQNNVGNKILFFYFLCHFSGRQLWSANSGVPYSISTPKRHLLFTRNPGQYMSKVGEGYLHRGKSIQVILFQVHEDLNKFNTSFASFEFQNNLCKSS